MSDNETVSQELDIFDNAKAEGFYVDSLDFSFDPRHQIENNLPVNMQILSEQIAFLFPNYYNDARRGTKVLMEFPNFADYHPYLTNKNYKLNKPGLDNASCNAKGMKVPDPCRSNLYLANDKTEQR